MLSVTPETPQIQLILPRLLITRDNNRQFLHRRFLGSRVPSLRCFPMPLDVETEGMTRA